MTVELVSVAALSNDRVIGADDGVPWDLPEDTRQYRQRIAGSPVILGRRTFEMMREDLPGATQIVMSRSQRDFAVSSAHHAGSVDEAIEIAAQRDADRAYVIGGGGIYRLFQPHLDRMFLSRVPGEYNGDTYYPEWDHESWTLVDTTDYLTYTLEEWVRTD